MGGKGDPPVPRKGASSQTLGCILKFASCEQTRLAEGVGFEPTRAARPGGFRDRSTQLEIYGTIQSCGQS